MVDNRVVITGVKSGCEREFHMGLWTCRNCHQTEEDLALLGRELCPSLTIRAIRRQRA